MILHLLCNDVLTLHNIIRTFKTVDVFVRLIGSKAYQIVGTFTGHLSSRNLGRGHFSIGCFAFGLCLCSRDQG